MMGNEEGSREMAADEDKTDTKRKIQQQRFCIFADRATVRKVNKFKTSQPFARQRSFARSKADTFFCIDLLQMTIIIGCAQIYRVLCVHPM
jgi:ribosomal 30S subunit maturation factor RimM